MTERPLQNGEGVFLLIILKGYKKVLGAVLKAAPGCTKKDKRPFTPHLTVANRDIPSGASVAALQVMNELNLVEDFPVDNVAIFERRGGKWNVAWCGEL